MAQQLVVVEKVNMDKNAKKAERAAHNRQLAQRAAESTLIPDVVSLQSLISCCYYYSHAGVYAR